MNKYKYKVEKNIEIIEDCDVLVVGGGLGGICAALSASDLGMKTILIEKNSTIGGQAAEINTWGLDGFIGEDGQMIVKGYPWEILKRIIEKGNSDPLFKKINMETMETKGKKCALEEMGLEEYIPFIDTKSYINAFNDQYIDVNDYRITALEMLEEKNILVMMGTPVVDTIIDNEKITGVIIQGEFDKFAIMAKRVVDTSQNAIVCAHLGKKMKYTETYFGTLPRVANVDINRLIEYIEKTDEDWFVRPMKEKKIDGTILRTLLEKECPMAIEGFKTALEIAIKDDIRYEKIKNTYKSRLTYFYERNNLGAFWVLSSILRETDASNPIEVAKTIKTAREYQMLTYEFFKKYIPGFENSMIIDTYANISKAYQISAEPSEFTEYTITLDEIVSGKCEAEDKIVKVLGHPVFGACGKGWWITLSSLIPKNLDNVIVSSKAACRKIHYIATCGLVGHAAGAAAAISIIDNTPLRQTSSEKIRNSLLKQGVIL